MKNMKDKNEEQKNQKYICKVCKAPIERWDDKCHKCWRILTWNRKIPVWYRLLIFILNIITLWAFSCLLYRIIGFLHNILFPYGSAFNTYYFDNWAGMFFWITLIICIIFLLKKDEKFYFFSKKFFLVGVIVSFSVYIIVNSFYIFSTASYSYQIPNKNNRIWLVTKANNVENLNFIGSYIWKEFRWNTKKSYDQCKEWAEKNKESDDFWNIRCGVWCTKDQPSSWWWYYFNWYTCKDEVSIKWNNMGCFMDREMWYEDSKFCQTFDNFDYCKKYWCDDNWWKSALIIFIVTLLIAFWIDIILKNMKKGSDISIG